MRKKFELDSSLGQEYPPLQFSWTARIWLIFKFAPWIWLLQICLTSIYTVLSCHYELRYKFFLN